MPLKILFLKECCASDVFGARNPGDFATEVTQINCQSDLTRISSFAGPSYFTIRSSV